MPTRLRVRAFAAFLAALATAAVACSPASPDLQDRVFLSIEVAGAPHPLVADTRIRLEFRASELQVHAGCNSMGGTWGIDLGRLQFDGGSSTQIGCDAARHAQDEWIVAFLASGPSVRLSGNDLTIEGGGTTIRLLDREVAEPDLNLVGTLWTVESIVAGDAVSSVPAGAMATLLFKDDGTFDINAGCNRGSGRWALVGSGIEVSAVGLTKMACGGAGGQLEAAVLQVVGIGTLQPTIEADLLTLSSGGGGLQLRG